jgi:hypothetical protein
MSTELFCLLSLITLRIKPNLSEEIALNFEALRQKKPQVWLVGVMSFFMMIKYHNKLILTSFTF